MQVQKPIAEPEEKRTQKVICFEFRLLRDTEKIVNLTLSSSISQIHRIWWTITLDLRLTQHPKLRNRMLRWLRHIKNLCCKVKFEIPRIDSRNRMDCGERIRNSAANPLDKWVYASGPTTLHEGSYLSTMANKLRWIQNESKPQRTGIRHEKHWKSRVREQSRHDEARSKRSSLKPCLWSSPRPKSTKSLPFFKSEGTALHLCRS